MVFPYDMFSSGEATERLPLLSSADGLRARRRAGEDRNATFGNTSSLQACVKAGVDRQSVEFGFGGVILERGYAPPVVVLQGYP